MEGCRNELFKRRADDAENRFQWRQAVNNFLKKDGGGLENSLLELVLSMLGSIPRQSTHKFLSVAVYTFNFYIKFLIWYLGVGKYKPIKS